MLAVPILLGRLAAKRVMARLVKAVRDRQQPCRTAGASAGCLTVEGIVFAGYAGLLLAAKLFG